jgi:hypothetical protein
VARGVAVATPPAMPPSPATYPRPTYYPVSPSPVFVPIARPAFAPVFHHHHRHH